LRLSLPPWAFVALTVVTTKAPAQASETLGRAVTLPDARCDSTTRQPTDSTVTSIQESDVPPRLLTVVAPTPPAAVKHGATTVLELVVDATGQLDPCDVRVVRETVPAWTDAVLRSLKKARYSPAQRYGLRVTVRVRQTFTAHRR
jgi:hypothetical protein